MKSGVSSERFCWATNRDIRRRAKCSFQIAWWKSPPLDRSLAFLRFYDKHSYGLKIATEAVKLGRPLFDAETPIGIEINLGPALVQSLVEQIHAQWPQYQQTLDSLPDGDDGSVGEA
jgi:hypothetical protein